MAPEIHSTRSPKLRTYNARQNWLVPARLSSTGSGTSAPLTSWASRTQVFQAKAGSPGNLQIAGAQRKPIAQMPLKSAERSTAAFTGCRTP